MATKAKFKWSEINSSNPMFSMARTTIETAFYGNNVEQIKSLAESYKLAKNAPGTIVTDIMV